MLTPGTGFRIEFNKQTRYDRMVSDALEIVECLSNEDGVP